MSDNDKHSITVSPLREFIDIMYVGELEIHTVLAYITALLVVCPGPLLISLLLALTAKGSDTPAICSSQRNVIK